MASWFTAEQRWALIKRYGLDGPKKPEAMAIEEALENSAEVREVWATQTQWPDQNAFGQLLVPKVLEAIGIETAPSEDDKPTKHKVKGKPGRPRVQVTEETFFEIIRQSLARASSTAKQPQPYYHEIAADTSRPVFLSPLAAA